MQINITAANIAVKITNDAGEAVLDYALENYSLAADTTKLVALFPEFLEALANAQEAAGKTGLV